VSDILYSTAVHEAAHAVTAVRTAIGKNHGLAKNGVVTIDRKDEVLGSVQIKKSGSRIRKWESDIMVSLAGGIAQCRVNDLDLSELAGHLSSDTRNIIYRLEKIHPGVPLEDASMAVCDNNLISASFFATAKDGQKRLVHAQLLSRKMRVAVALLCSYGNDLKAVQAIITNFPQYTDIVSDGWFTTLGKLTNRTTAILDKHWREVHLLANRLLEVGTMVGPEAEKFIREAASKETQSRNATALEEAA